MFENILKTHLRPADKYIYGFADLRGLLERRFSGFNYGISIGRKLDDKIIDSIVDGPTSEYYNHYLETNVLLEKLALMISNDLNDKGIEAIPTKPTVSINSLDTKYVKTLKTDISHKMVATRAGLGWIGKSDLFISRKFGPRLRLVSILSRIPLSDCSEPVNKSSCGNCNICVDVCPAKAANGILWDITVEREVFFDPWKCREQCAKFGRSVTGRNTRICGICVAVCPVGRKRKM